MIAWLYIEASAGVLDIFAKLYNKALYNMICGLMRELIYIYIYIYIYQRRSYQCCSKFVFMCFFMQFFN